MEDQGDQPGPSRSHGSRQGRLSPFENASSSHHAADTAAMTDGGRGPEAASSEAAANDTSSHDPSHLHTDPISTEESANRSQHPHRSYRRDRIRPRTTNRFTIPADAVETDEDEPESILPNAAAASIRATQQEVISTLNEQVFLQDTKKFRATGREVIDQILRNQRMKSSSSQDGPEEGREFESLSGEAFQTVVNFQHIFMTFAVFLQGMLCGFTVCQSLVVLLFIPPWEPLLPILSPIILPSNTLFYIVTTITALASLDRYDVGQSFLRTVKRSFTFQSGGLSIVAYFGVLMVGLISFPPEERLTLYLHNTSHIIHPQTNQIKDEVASELFLWRMGVIVRAVLATFGWLLISIRPGTSLLVKHLAETEKEFKENFS